MDIHSKETKQTSQEKAARTSHRISKYNTSMMNRIQVTKQKKTKRIQKNNRKQRNNKTRKQRKSHCLEIK
jgi:IS1 family transposase